MGETPMLLGLRFYLRATWSSYSLRRAALEYPCARNTPFVALRECGFLFEKSEFLVLARCAKIVIFAQPLTYEQRRRVERWELVETGGGAG